MRRHRRLRWISRHLPAVDSRVTPPPLRAHLPVWLAWNPGGGGALVQRVGLQPSRARFRLVQHALTARDTALLAVRPRRRRGGVERRAHLGRACHARLSTDDGWRPNEGTILQRGDRHAQLRRRADAFRPAVPGGRCRAHRSANRRERAQSGDGRRLSTRRRLPTSTRQAVNRSSTPIQNGRWRAPGARSGSPGG